MPIWLPDEARSAEFAIHLFAKDVPQSIHSLFDCRWGTKCRCCAILAILPFVTLLIAEDEAQSAELVQAILLSYLFSCILLNLYAFPISFLPIGGSTPKHNFLFSSYILFYFGVLPNLYLIFCPYIPRTLSRIVTTLGYFRILPHRPLWSTTTSITLGYYHIVYFLLTWYCWVRILSTTKIGHHGKSDFYMKPYLRICLNSIG